MIRKSFLPLFLSALFASYGCADPVAECDSPSMVCGGVCVSPSVDRDNCGACGNTCSANLVCSAGSCVCPAGKELCDGRCVDVRTDSLHCGGCGLACDDGTFCRAGECGCDGDDCTCPGELCDGICVDTTADELNCGACGVVCDDGQHCVSGSCAAGDLFAACFQSGRVVPFLAETRQPSGSIASGIDGPQSLALLGDRHLVVVGGLDDVLYVLDRGTMDIVGSMPLGDEGGRMPNQVLVRGDRAYVVNSGVHTVQVIDLANPATPVTRFEISTGPETNPGFARFDEAGTLWVSMMVTNQVVPLTVGEAAGSVGEAITLPSEGLGAHPNPGEIAIRDGMMYVAMNNLGDDWMPFGAGAVAVVRLASKETSLIDLSDDCKNPGFLVLDGDVLKASCTGSYVGDGAVAIVDLETEGVEVIATGGAPSRMSKRERLFVAGGSEGSFLELDDDGAFVAIDACPNVEWEFVADVLAVP
ncbi:MAG TPA: MXAN_6577-like cysteine-rich protein [Vulgatibacter sp.]